ncbi:hypothetical protein FQR65_LT18402 [Abscondita terminalis]|nr:hypothetical protein FQR65_LT18402 [Abscondita terminalis]
MLKLKNQYLFEDWLLLSQATLTSVQLFNRRRAGEIERMYIEDFQNHEKINSDDLLNMSQESQQIAKNYVRFVIRGKLNRTVPVLLSLHLKQCIQLILKYRTMANVSSNNPFVFGIPGGSNKRYKYLRACQLMRKFANDSGAHFPHQLRGTKLRKHIATNCINLNLSENEVIDVANFMGHEERIHRKHYRQPIVSREILRMSQVLVSAQGGDDDDDDEDEDDEDAEYNYNGTHKQAEEQPTLEALNDNGDILNSGNSTSNPDDIFGKMANPKRKTRSTSPYGKGKSKIRWTTQEKETAFRCFSDNIATGLLPSFKRIAEIQSVETILQSRNANVIKTWVSNQIKSKRTQLENKNKQNRISCDFVENVYQIFSQLILEKRVPTTVECVSKYESNPMLQKLSPIEIQELIIKKINT